MPAEKEQVFPCKQAGCSGSVTYRPEVVKAFRGAGKRAEAPPEGRILRVYLSCDPNRHVHEYVVRAQGPTRVGGTQ